MSTLIVPNPKCNRMSPATRWRFGFLLLISTVFSVNLSATMIAYQISLNGTTGSYVYQISGFDFRANAPCVNPINPGATGCSDELDIDSDPNVFSAISNGVAPSDYDLLLFEPNDPPGAVGDYSALAIVDHATLAGLFGVSFTLTGSGTPGPQDWSISQFDNNGIYEGTLVTGTTVPINSNIPEPSSVTLGGIGLVIGLAYLMYRLSGGTGFCKKTM